jgi:hypothetical protein
MSTNVEACLQKAKLSLKETDKALDELMAALKRDAGELWQHKERRQQQLPAEDLLKQRLEKRKQARATAAISDAIRSPDHEELAERLGL